MTARIGRMIIAIAGGVLFALVVPLAAFADNLATVDCGDGSPLSTAADAATLLSLQASVQGMVENPSGMSCSLSQAGALDPTLSLGPTSNGKPFVVGGGRYDRGPGPGSSQGCGVNFSLNAHTNSSGFTGEQRYTINNADGCSAIAGHLRANVTCLNVAGNVGQIKGMVTEVTGFYATLIAVGAVVETDVVDNGQPSGGNPDLIAVNPGDSGSVCLGDVKPDPFPVENGNITVHD